MHRALKAFRGSQGSLCFCRHAFASCTGKVWRFSRLGCTAHDASREFRVVGTSGALFGFFVRAFFKLKAYVQA